MNKPTKSQQYRLEMLNWNSARSRATNPNDPWYKYGGGSGYQMCDEWLNSFDQFLADMGPKPPHSRLTRRDRSLGWFPDNCYWQVGKGPRKRFAGTAKLGRKNTRYLTAKGRTQSVMDWSRETQIPADNIMYRLKVGWLPEQALGYEPPPTKARKVGPRPRLVLTAYGKTQSIKEWSRETGIKEYTLYWRVAQGYSHEEAVSKPLDVRVSRFRK